MCLLVHETNVCDDGKMENQLNIRSDISEPEWIISNYEHGKDFCLILTAKQILAPNYLENAR